MLRFVYVEGMRGPTPELWHDQPKTGSGMNRGTPLQSHDLDDAFASLTLDQLTKLYPFKGAPE